MTPIEHAEVEADGEALLGSLAPNASVRKVDLTTPCLGAHGWANGRSCTPTMSPSCVLG